MASNGELIKFAETVLTFTTTLEGDDPSKIESLAGYLAGSEYIKKKPNISSSHGCNDNPKVKCKCVQIGYITLPTIPISLACKPFQEKESADFFGAAAAAEAPEY